MKKFFRILLAIMFLPIAQFIWVIFPLTILILFGIFCFMFYDLILWLQNKENDFITHLILFSCILFLPCISAVKFIDNKMFKELEI